MFRASTPSTLAWYVPWGHKVVAVKLQEKVPFNLVPDCRPALQKVIVDPLGLKIVTPGLSAPDISSLTLRVRVIVWLEDVTSTEFGERLIEL